MTYQSLLTAAGKLAPLTASETDDDYFKRLILAVSALPVPAFERLPLKAQNYFDEACDALSAGIKLPAPEGYDRETVLYPPAPIRITRPNGSAYTPPPKMTAAVFTPRPGAEPMRDTLIKVMIANPDLSFDQLMRRLNDLHIKISTETAASQRGFTVTVLRLVREAGWRPPA